jgi:aspartate aminotransferase-like enzyme
VLDLYDGTLAAVDEVAAIARASGSARELVDAIASVARIKQNPDDVTIVALRRDA